MSRCQKCGNQKQSHDLYRCGRCLLLYCLGCLDKLRLSFCEECAVYERTEEIESRRHRLCRAPTPGEPHDKDN